MRHIIGWLVLISLFSFGLKPAELNDLSKKRPKLRQEMIDIWNQYSKDVGVVLPPGGAMRIDMNLPTTP